jgi:hypothetical protein
MYSVTSKEDEYKIASTEYRKILYSLLNDTTLSVTRIKELTKALSQAEKIKDNLAAQLDVDVVTEIDTLIKNGLMLRVKQRR